MTGKYCIVPGCFNSSMKTPEKLFFYVPENPKIRNKWMKAVKRVNSIGPKTKAHCCEDHFDLENDMNNYVKYKLVGGRLKLKKGIVPHRFACHKIARLAMTSSECIASTSKNPNLTGMSELDRFKRRLVRSVSRMLLRERRPPDEVWETLRKGTGKDCKELWTRMRALTLKKLARLLAADDYPAKVASVARMTPTDWLMFDLALAHEDIDVIDQHNKLGKHGDKSSPLWALLRLAITFNVDALSGARLASVWVSIARNYNSSGRECSPMLLQKRWYQLKQTSREKFYIFWQEWKGKHDNIASMKFAPTRVQAVVAKCNPHLITQPFSTWEELKAQGKVVLVEQMQAIIKDANKSQNPEKEAEAEKEPEVILMEPKIPMIDLGADSDEEGNTNIDTQTHTDKDINTTLEENTSQDNTQVKVKPDTHIDTQNKTEKDNTKTTQENNTSTQENTVVTVKAEPLEQDGLANIQIVQATHVPTEDIDNENDPKQYEVKTEVYDDITVTETVLQKTIETDFVLPNTAKSLVEDKEQHVEDDIFSKDVIATNVMLENSDDEDDIITFIKDNSPERAATSDASGSKEVETKRVERESSAELEFVDDGIEMDDGDEGECLDGSEDDKDDETKALKRPETNEDENLAKIDLKLIMKPVVYTIKLDQMVTLKDKPYDAVESKDIINAILDESKPVTKLVKITPEQNTSVASLTNDDKHMSDDIIKLAPPMEIIPEQNTLIASPTDDKHMRTDTINLAPPTEVEFKAEPQLKKVEIKTEEQANEVQEAEMREESESESDEDVERISLKSAIFRKPKVKEYSPIQLCKNPDFNTRLQRLNVMFYAYETNRQYLKEIKPMTIDLSKTFESKLVNNTIYLKSEGPRLKLKRDMKNNKPTTDEIGVDKPQNPELNIPTNHIIGEERRHIIGPGKVKNSASPNLSVKCVSSADNSSVKYLEVAMNIDQFEDKKPLIDETNTITANSLSSQPDKLMTEAKTIEIESVTTVNEMVVNNVKSQPDKLHTHAKSFESLHNSNKESFIGSDATTSTNVTKAMPEIDTVGSVIEAVIQTAMSQQPPRKTIAKKKVTQTIPWYRPSRPEPIRPSWLYPTKTNQLPFDSLLTIDTLNKMLNFCLSSEGAPQPDQIKKKTKKTPTNPKTNKNFCCWIKELYSTKEFGKLRAHPCIDKAVGCTCCCRRNFDKSTKPTETDNKETTTDKKTVQEPKGKAARRKSATTSKNDNIETITLDEPQDNDIEEVDDSNVESVDKDDLWNDQVDSLETRRPSVDDITVHVETVSKKRTYLPKKSKTAKANKKHKSNDTNTQTDTEKAPKTRRPSKYRDTVFYTDDTEAMPDEQEITEDSVTKIASTDLEADAEEIDITTVDPSPPAAPLIVTKVTSRPNAKRKRKWIEPLLYNNIPVLVPAWQVSTPPPLISPNKPLIKITISPPITNLTKCQTFLASKPSDIPKLTDASQSTASSSPPAVIELSDDEGDGDYQPPRHALPTNAKRGRGRPRKIPLQTPRKIVVAKEPESCIPKLLNDSTNNQNIGILRKCAGLSPFHVGRNRILLTTANIEADMFTNNPLTKVKVTASVSAPLVALPLGIRFAATQSGELSCFVDLKQFDMRKFKHLPGIVERVRNQLNCHKIPIIYSAETNEDVQIIVKKLAEFQNKEPDAILQLNMPIEETTNETTNINTNECLNDTNAVKPAETTDINEDNGTTEQNGKPVEETTITEDNVPTSDQDKSKSPQAIVEIDDDTGETRDITLNKDQSDNIERTCEIENEVPSISVSPMLKIKDFAAVKEHDATTTTKKTILSDLMEMSGISADDTLPEPPVPEPPAPAPVPPAPEQAPPDPEQAPPGPEQAPPGPEQAPPSPAPVVLEDRVQDDLDEERYEVAYQAIQGVIQLTPVTSVEVLKYSRNQKAKFFRLDLQHGTIIPTEVSIIQKDKVKKLPKNAVVVDLTKPNKEIVEIHSQGKDARQAHVLVSNTTASRKPGIFQKRRTDQKTYLDQLRSMWKNTQQVTPANNLQSQPVQKHPRKEKILTRIDTQDSDVSMEEEFMDSSDEASQPSEETPQPKAPEKRRPTLYDSSDSDDEPLAKKATRKAESINEKLNTSKANDNTKKENDNTNKANDTNKNDEEFEDEEPEGDGSMSIEGLMDEIMSDDEDFILGT